MFKNKVFISYAREDSGIAQRLYDDLKEAGVELWFDRKNLMPGQQWNIEIKKAIKDSTIFLALISSNTLSKRGFTQKELKTALDIVDEMPEGNIFIIPVRVDDCQLDVRLQHFQWLDLFPSYSDGLRKLLKILKPEATIKSGEAWERK